jgi:hypothetical protein
MKLFKLTLAIAIAAILANGATAYADATHTSTGDGGDWNVAGTWDVNAVPHAGDDVIISAGDIVYVDDPGMECTNLTIEAVSGAGTGGELQVQDNGVLTVLGALIVEDGATSTKSGKVDMQSGGVLEVSGSITVGADALFEFTADSGEGRTQPIVRATATGVDLDGTFSGSGSLGGRFDEDANDYFEIVGSDAVLFSFSPIYITTPIRCNGATASFTLSGDVENDGTILATNGGDVEFSGVNSRIDANSSGLFQVTASSTMWFDMGGDAAITSGADFNISAGLMQFSRQLSTDGGYQQTGGTCLVVANESFTATGAYP